MKPSPGHEEQSTQNMKLSPYLQLRHLGYEAATIILFVISSSYASYVSLGFLVTLEWQELCLFTLCNSKNPSLYIGGASFNKRLTKILAKILSSYSLVLDWTSLSILSRNSLLVVILTLIGLSLSWIRLRWRPCPSPIHPSSSLIPKTVP